MINEKQIIVFVVLHYKVFEMTKDCVDSLLGLIQYDEMNIHIVVVDNASSNGSMERIESIYSNNKRVHTIYNKKNLGFSRANNIGFEYARDSLEATFIVVINNDTEIRQKDICKQIIHAYELGSSPYIIGPDIYVKRKHLHQNPLSIKERTELEVKKSLSQYLKRADDLASSEPARRERMRAALGSCCFGRLILGIRLIGLSLKNSWWVEHENCVLHGAALIFTPRFVSSGELPFDPPTFLYKEEEILAVRCRKNGWRTIYNPRLQIIHYDDGSTEYINKIDIEKRRFTTQHSIDSLRILLRLFNEQND